MPIYNSKVPDTAGRKTKRRRGTQAIAKCYAFHANAVRNEKLFHIKKCFFEMPRSQAKKK